MKQLVKRRKQNSEQKCRAGILSVVLCEDGELENEIGGCEGDVGEVEDGHLDDLVQCQDQSGGTLLPIYLKYLDSEKI